MSNGAITTNGHAGERAASAEPATLAAAFDELREGQHFASRGRTVTEGDLVSFSALTGDWHPQHADAAWAAASPFGERVAHGMLVLSYSIGLLPLDPDRVLALRGVREAIFKRPVLIGDTIRVEGRIASLRPLDAATGLVQCDCRVRNQDGRLAAKVGLDVIWRREHDLPAQAAPQSEAEPAPVDGQSLRSAFLIGDDELCPWGPPL
jgi:3-hydroxybutyryl-CoA dehydratase